MSYAQSIEEIGHLDEEYDRLIASGMECDAAVKLASQLVREKLLKD